MIQEITQNLGVNTILEKMITVRPQQSAQGIPSSQEIRLSIPQGSITVVELISGLTTRSECVIPVEYKSKSNVIASNRLQLGCNRFQMGDGLGTYKVIG